MKNFDIIANLAVARINREDPQRSILLSRRRQPDFVVYDDRRRPSLAWKRYLPFHPLRLTPVQGKIVLFGVALATRSTKLWPVLGRHQTRKHGGNQYAFAHPRIIAPRRISS